MECKAVLKEKEEVLHALCVSDFVEWYRVAFVWCMILSGVFQ